VTDQPPNVLLVMCDQLRWDVIAAHGHPLVDTPHIDRLAASGTTFSRCYTEAPVCVPARATMLTGRLAHRNAVFDNGDVLDPDATTFASVAAARGYRTQAIGKMHFTPPRRGYGLESLALSEEIPDCRANDEFLQDMIEAGFAHVQEPHGIRHELYYVPQVSQLPADLHTTAWTGRRTVEFVEAAGSDPRPWLCWTSFIKPHPPFDPPAPWYRRYDPLAVPDPVRAPAERDHLEYRVRTQHRFKWTSPDLPLSAIRTMRAYYYASVSFVDHWVGQILDALDRTGQRNRTLVVFTADHGESLGDHWAYGKRTFYDSAARIPMLVSLPGTLPERNRVDEYVGLADVAPTIVDATGAAETLNRPDGRSMIPRLVTGTWAQQRQPWAGVLGRDREATYAAFDEQVKYVYSAADDLEYALAVGPGEDETQRLPAGSPLHARAMELGGELRRRLAREGLGHVVDGDRWRRFGPVEEVGTDDDRHHRGRGLQFADWVDAIGICTS
jgi:arylsulfatase